jgi:hypothetical protein
MCASSLGCSFQYVHGQAGPPLYSYFPWGSVLGDFGLLSVVFSKSLYVIWIILCMSTSFCICRLEYVVWIVVWLNRLCMWHSLKASTWSTRLSWELVFDLHFVDLWADVLYNGLLHLLLKTLFTQDFYMLYLLRHVLVQEIRVWMREHEFVALHAQHHIYNDLNDILCTCSIQLAYLVLVWRWVLCHC